MKNLIRLFFLTFGVFCYPFILQAQWYPISVPTTFWLEAITFTDTTHGFVAVWDGSMLESSDGGVSWHVVLTGSSNGLADISFPLLQLGIL
jgi:photosystem II stability/assembly factor-like uncharacterized protein